MKQTPPQPEVRSSRPAVAWAVAASWWETARGRPGAGTFDRRGVSDTESQSLECCMWEEVDEVDKNLACFMHVQRGDGTMRR